MKATARAHPIQGLLKYHGLADAERNVPVHDSISLCTAPSATTTTVEFGYDADSCLVNGEPVDDEGADRVRTVLDIVRERADVDTGARVQSENSFPSNVGLGASASAYAALALAATDAAGISLSTPALSALARRGATSAARSVAGGFAHLRTSMDDADCTAERIPDAFEEDIRIVVGHVPEFKRTEHAHQVTPESHLFRSRLAHIHESVGDFRDAIRDGDFHRTFELAERDSLNLLAVTMTGPDGWVYWQPDTRRLLQTARRLRDEADVPVYFSCDTGATAYLNTTAEHVDRVTDAVESLDVDTDVWRVGGPPTLLEEHLF
ncbi:diphosphomevalonate decarboxylase [Haloarculaceae archaeon H-GB2-1]|nr:diphosphomevalonate decarboxylase [Haloarculaceae archaeon H-GB1-1]MEA5386164.1 diphosphomevalonate decarboxylase [Haloarculaceae archaeon H-GB11]MEA5407670.1 diphosphomevalonate decarboxylase [Haloarculaceae archaeon H-GB2-1]